MPRTCVGQLPIIQEEYDVVPSRPLDPTTDSLDSPRLRPHCKVLHRAELGNPEGEGVQLSESVLGSNGAKRVGDVSLTQTGAEIDPSPRDDTHIDTIVNLCYYTSVAVLMSPLRLVSNTLYIASLFAWCSSGI